MKTPLLLTLLALVLSPALRAGDPATNVEFHNIKGFWYAKGQLWKGQVHKYVDGRIYVTGDVDSHRGTWIKAADLDPASRGWLGIGSDRDDAAFEADNAQRAAEVQEYKQKRLASAIQAEAAANARLAQLEHEYQQAQAAKAADLAQRQQAYQNYLQYLQTLGWLKYTRVIK